jgi:hypothetical protein
MIAAPFSARAAQSYDNCAGFIDTLPATITTQGTWCLRHDLSTAITSGEAITINTNNVTIDCNDFKLGGLAGGAGSIAYGIYANNRLNATVRHCNIRGFLYGVLIEGSSGGHVIEDNRLNGNLYVSVWLSGDGSVVRRNQVTNTGGGGLSSAYGILTDGAVDVLDNTVSGVLPTANSSGNGDATGIVAQNNPNGSISGNRIRGLVKLGTGSARGIDAYPSDRISLDDNLVVGDGSAGSIGLRCSSSHGRAKHNIVNGFATQLFVCGNDGNVLAP